jgi:hypothetical protein
VLAFAAVVPLLLRVFKLPRLGDWLEPGDPLALPDDPQAAERLAGRIVRRVDLLIRLGWPVVRRGCLVRGITRYRFLREAGIGASLCFGMGRPEGEDGYSGHCWVELDGRALAEKREPRPIYTETYRISPQARRERERAAAAIRPETA